jgi:HAD superfamily hydrolase (TIGR01662 family)
MVDAVIFDLDGTIIDSADIYFRIIDIVFERLGLAPVSRDDVLDAVKTGDFDWDRVLPSEIKGRKDELMAEARGIIQGMAPQMFRESAKLIPGAADVLKEISARGIKVGLVTSTSMKHLGDKLYPLRESGIEDLFEVVITTDDVKKKKPAADPLIECGKRLGVTGEKSVYVGDSRTDIRAGKAAGMRTIGVLTGMNDYESLKAEDPDMIIESVVGLRDLMPL